MATAESQFRELGQAVRDAICWWEMRGTNNSAALGRALRLVEAMARPWTERLLQVPAGEAPHDIDNLLGEAVARAVKSFRLFAGVTGKEFYGWFKKIVVCLAAKLRRREGARRRNGALASLERDAQSARLAELLQDDVPSPEAVAMLRESANAVRRAVKLLPADERRLVQLVVEGVSLAEIERTFGGDPHACWRRAKRHLRTALCSLREAPSRARSAALVGQFSRA